MLRLFQRSAQIPSIHFPSRTNKFALLRHFSSSLLDMTKDNRLQLSLSADEIGKLCEDAIAESKKIQDGVVAVEGQRTYANTIAPLADDEAHFDVLNSSCDFPSYVSPLKDVRDAATAATQKLQAFAIESQMRMDVYEAVSAFEEQRKASNDSLPAEKQRFVDRLLRDFRRNGLHLDEATRTEVAKVQQRMSELGIAFSKNLNENMDFHAFARSELQGLPDDFLDGLDKVEETDADGNPKLKVTLKYPDVIPVLKKAKSSETRKTMDILNGKKCMDENVPMLEEMLKLRSKLADLLGYERYADYVLEIRMAKESNRVLDFLGSLRQKLVPMAEKEMLELRRLKAAETGESLEATELLPWDFQYYHTQLMETKYNVDDNDTKVYFPMKTVTSGLLHIYQNLLSLRFDEVESPTGVWHDDVRLFEVYDQATEEYMGQFYLDLHPRDGKYGHAAVFPLQPAAVYESDGRVQRPVVAMVCNFTKPTADKPSLLKHSEVVTFFHEFGHAMHGICTKSTVARFSGTSVERDFVETPSQMLENWCWEKQSLKLMSGHYERPNEPLPDDLLERMVAAKNVDNGLLYLRQIFFGLFDMTVHTAKDGVVDTAALWHRLRKEVSLFAQAEGTNPAGSFGHIMGGYQAGYYGYLWSEVFSADLYNCFKQSGDILDSTLGKRYRSCILAPGGSIDADEMLRNFLEREPEQSAFLRHIGLDQ